VAADPKNTDKGAIVTLSSQGAGTVTSNTLQNVNACGVTLVINATAVTGNLQVTLQGYDNASASWYNILVGPSITTAETTIMRVYPSITTSNTSTISSYTLPEWWRVFVTVGGSTPSVTATVGACLQI